jgi:hypothetical protein
MEQRRGAICACTHSDQQQAPMVLNPLVSPPSGLLTGLQVLDMGRDLLQSFKPLKSVHEHVCAWHFYARMSG